MSVHGTPRRERIPRTTLDAALASAADQASPQRSTDKATLGGKVVNCLQKQRKADQATGRPRRRPPKPQPKQSTIAKYYQEKNPVAERTRGYAHMTEERRHAVAIFHFFSDVPTLASPVTHLLFKR